MAYSNYFNQGMGSTTYANYGTATSYRNGPGGTPYGTTCVMTYTNYANASHVPVSAFNIGVNQSVFNSGAPIASSIAAIKAIRNALDTISTTKVNTSGKAHFVTPAWNSLTDASLVAGQNLKSAQVTELANNTKALWDVVNGGVYTAPTSIGAGQRVLGQDLKTLATNVQTMASCTQYYINYRTGHDGYTFPGGASTRTDFTTCINHAYLNASYDKYSNLSAFGTAGTAASYQ